MHQQQVMYELVPTGEPELMPYSPVQAVGHVLGLRRETTNHVVTSLQLAASSLPGDSCSPADPKFGHFFVCSQGVRVAVPVRVPDW